MATFAELCECMFNLHCPAAEGQQSPTDFADAFVLFCFGCLS